MLYFGIQFKLHPWKDAHKLLWFARCITTTQLVRLDAVLVITKVDQTWLHLFARVAKTKVHYCGDLTTFETLLSVS